MKIAVTGGTGFVGKAIVRELVRREHDVTVLARKPPGDGFLDPEDVGFVKGDVVSGEGLEELTEGKEVLVHLVGIIKEAGTNTFDGVHRQGTVNATVAANNSGIRRYIHMSALGTRAEAVSRYHRTKWAGEEAVRASGLNWTIFRPSIIFGPGDSFVNMLAGIMRKAPAMPVIGGGRNLMQPVYVEDVAAMFATAVESEWAVGGTYEIGGADVLTFRNILDITSQVIEKKCLFINVNSGIVRPFLRVIEAVGIPSPMSTDQLIMMSEDNIRKGGDPVDRFQMEMKGFEEGIRAYLSKTKE